MSDFVYTLIIFFVTFCKMDVIRSSSPHDCLELSMNLRIRSAFFTESITFHLRCWKNSSFHSLTHGVSKKMIWESSSLNIHLMHFWVVWGRGETIETFSSIRAFMKVDFQELGLHISATYHTFFIGICIIMVIWNTFSFYLLILFSQKNRFRGNLSIKGLSDLQAFMSSIVQSSRPFPSRYDKMLISLPQPLTETVNWDICPMFAWILQ